MNPFTGPFVGNLDYPQSLYAQKLHEMPAKERLDAAGPFVNGVFDLDREIARRVRVPAMEHLGTGVIKDCEIVLGQKSFRYAVKELVT